MAAPSPKTQSPYPQTGSLIGTPTDATANSTNVSLSTMIIIKVGDNPVGAIQKLDVNEKRSITMVDEVGTDGHIDSAPTKSTDISGGCERIRFMRMKIGEAFSRGFVHVKSQRFPFDIHIIDTMGGEIGGGQEIVTILKNVWINSISYAYNKDGWIVSDNMSWEAEDIYTYVGSEFTSSANGGLKNMPLEYDVYEVAADVGKRRGSMDAPGILLGPQRS